MLRKYRNQFVSESIPRFDSRIGTQFGHHDPHKRSPSSLSAFCSASVTLWLWPGWSGNPRPRLRPGQTLWIGLPGCIFQATEHAHVLFGGFVRGKDQPVGRWPRTNRMKVVNGSAGQRICLPQAMCQMPSLGTADSRSGQVQVGSQKN